MRFGINTNVLHYYCTKRQEVSLGEKVEYNNKGYPNKHPRNYKMVRQMYSMVGNPSIHDYKEMVRSNLMMNFTVTIEYVEQYEEICGPITMALKENIVME